MYCNHCNKENSADSTYCSYCGQKLNSIDKEDKLIVEEQVTSNTKQKKNRKWLFAGIIIILLLAVGVGSYYFQSQKNLWSNWVVTYQQELSDYYLSDEEQEELSGYVEQSSTVMYGEAQDLLKQEMITFKDKIIATNKKYIEDIELGLKQIDSDYDLKFAYEEELTQIKQAKEEIEKLKQAKQYPEAIAKIEDCKSIEEKIQEIKTGWYMNIVQKDISSYPKVKLYLDIKDQADQVIENLDKSIFFLTQKDAVSGEYIKKEITNVLQLDQNESININLVADLSASMSNNLQSAKGIMNNFLNTVQFGVGDQIALTGFSDTSYVIQNFTSEKNDIISRVNDMTTYGGTKLYDTLIEAVINVYGQSGAKCVIAFTDGLDNRSASSSEEVIRVAKNCGIPIFIIGIGYEVDDNILGQIANSTGGYYTNIIDINNTMQDIYNTIYTRQKQVYCLEYQSDESNMMNLQDIGIYLRGTDGGGTIDYAFKPADDMFNMLLNNYLNSYTQALTEGDPSVMSRAGYANTNGGVFAETKQYIEKNKLILAEQLLQAEVTDVIYVDENTYQITSEEVYDIQQIKDYNTEIANDTSDEMQTVRRMLLSYYTEEELNNSAIAINKQRKLRGHYDIKKSSDGKWQINDFTGSYEKLESTVYTAYIESHILE